MARRCLCIRSPGRVASSSGIGVTLAEFGGGVYRVTTLIGPSGYSRSSARAGVLLAFISTVLAAASLGTGRAGDPSPVRERLLLAVAGSLDLIRQAQESRHQGSVEPRLFDDRKELPSRRFPTKADAARYDELRPWTEPYLSRMAIMYQPLPEKPARWPRPDDGTALRTLLSDADPAIRGLAAEALATLHDPDDVPRIAALFDDHEESVPALGWNLILTARRIPPSELIGSGGEPLVIVRSWQPRRVSGYALAAVGLMTGQDFRPSVFGSKWSRVNPHPTGFEGWWSRSRGGRSCVWYWQERLHRELAAATAVPFPHGSGRSGGEDYLAVANRHRALIEQRLAAARQAVADELAFLPAEIEVKVRLLAVNRYSSGLGVELDEPLLGPFECRRLPAGRLLDLLDRKGMWEDVASEEWAYNTLVVQLASRADRLFQPEHVARLRAVQLRESSLGWPARTALTMGIARLLPAAQTGALDDPDTWDGVLRDGIRNSSEVFARGSLARELTRAGLPRNYDFLEAQFFAETKSEGIPDLRGSILTELGAEPLTPEKRLALRKLLLHERFIPLWIQPGANGFCLHRYWAVRGVNAHAGRTVLSDQHESSLGNPARSGEALNEVLRTVADALPER